MSARRIVIGNARRRAGYWWRVPVALLLWSLWAAPIVGGFVALGLLRGWARELPEVPDLAAWQASAPRTSRLLAADGTVLAELPFEQGVAVGRRELVRFAEIPPLLIDAVLAAEDNRFFTHPGVDLQAVVRAALANYRAGRVVEGASTITQQLARNLLPEEIGTEQSIRRKVREGLLAIEMERRWGKRELFEAYANFVFLGGGAYGFVAAARAYFDRPLAALDAGQAALLAGLIQAPSNDDPFQHPAAAKLRRDLILERMVRGGRLDAATGQAAAAAPLVLTPAPQPYGTIAPWTTEHVRRIVVDELATARLRGGLVVETTAQPALAARAEAAALRHTAKLDRGDGPPELAAVLWDHRTGYVEALVGGRDWAVSQFDRAMQGCRQPGSAWKPIIYAAALEDNSITQGTALRDAPIAEYDPTTGVHWRPRAGKTFRGLALAADALAASLNAPANDVLHRVGAAAVVDLARRLGIDTAVSDLQPMALGTSCVKPMALARAFAILARRGWSLPARFVTRVRRGDEVLLDEAVPEDPHVDPARRLDRLAAVAGRAPDARLGLADTGPALDERSAFLIDDLLTGPITRGTATAARALGRPAAGKTGTTNDNTDAWFVGFTDRLTSAVWLGHDKPSTDLGPRDDGAKAALPLWMVLVAEAEGARPPAPVPGPPPANLVQERIDRETGLLVAPGAGGGALLWFKPGTAPVGTSGGPRSAGSDLGRVSREF